MRTLVTGGVRSGKSTVAERLVADSAATVGDRDVTYIATGPGVADADSAERADGADGVAQDSDWADRIAAHRSRRPASWTTVETTDLVEALRALPGPALVDCLGTWLTAVLDELEAWQQPRAQWEPALRHRVADLVEAWTQCPHDVVAVTNEVGWGVVSEHRSGRIFADELGRVNQAIAAVSDRVLLVVAGQVLPLREP